MHLQARSSRWCANTNCIRLKRIATVPGIKHVSPPLVLAAPRRGPALPVKVHSQCLSLCRHHFIPSKRVVFLIKIWYMYTAEQFLVHVVTVANSPSYAQSRLDRKVRWGI